MKWFRLAALVAAFFVPAIATAAHTVAARFPAGATAVTVDVFEIGGAQVADNVAASIVQIDTGNDSDVWTFDLSTVSGYPANCEAKDYVVRFIPDAANCDDGGTPTSCVIELEKVNDATCVADPTIQVSYEYATAVVSAQGITQSVRDHFNRRSTEPVRWRKIETADDGDFTSPDATRWEVFFYSTEGGFPHVTCTVDTTVDPSSSLPSSANCAGN